MSKDLIICASGLSIRNEIQRFKSLFKQFNTLILGHHVFNFFADFLEIDPTFITYLDAYSAVGILPKILNKKRKLNTTIFVFDPILTHSYKLQKTYIGGSTKGQTKALGEQRIQWTEKYYKETYLSNLEKIQRYCKVEKIKSTSFRKLKEIRYFELVKNGGELLPHSEFLSVLESQSIMCVMELWMVGRLTTCVMPLIYHLTKVGRFKYKNLLLAGFDGGGPRYMTGKYESKREIELSEKWNREYIYYMPMWKKLFIDRFGMNIYKITDSPCMKCIDFLKI